jgi:hypothetical protein
MTVRMRREQIDLLVLILENLDGADRSSLLECIAPGLREEVELQASAPETQGDPGGRVYDGLNTQEAA